MKKTLRDIASARQDFPILHQTINGKPLIYFDNAATSQKPQSVIDAINYYYQHDNANVHRGVHTLSQRATTAFEQVRTKIKTFINARTDHEIVFVKGATEGINLVANSFLSEQLNSGDEIIITQLEHHANIVPWHLIAEKKQAKLNVVPINQRGEIDMNAYRQAFNARTRIVAVNHISNALGTVNPVQQMIEIAHQHQIPVLVDGAQAAPHMQLDMQDLDCDFYVFSGHKCYGPTGIGVLYAKEKWLEHMPPYQGGGEMITQVSFINGIRYKEAPYRFEPGTPHIEGVIGLGAAIDYIESIGLDAIQHYEDELHQYAEEQLKKISGLRIIGQAKNKAGIISFVMEGVHAHDVGTILDADGIATRSGHHCAMPIMEFFQLAATSRASFAFYNTLEEIDVFVAALKRVQEIFC